MTLLFMPPIIFSQSKGWIWLEGEIIGLGYSGHGLGLRNAEFQNKIGIGPIPRGWWSIDRWDDNHPPLGPIVAILSPLVGTETFGRSLFRIHGDNSKFDMSASDGCPIMGPFIRQALRKSGYTNLLVIG